MRVLVIGAGAVGGWLAGVLSRGGAEVVMLARGATLNALRSRGLHIVAGNNRQSFQLPASDRVSDFAAADAVILAVKTYAFSNAVLDAAPAFAHGPVVVTAMNGVPWWFLKGLGGPLKDQRLESIDPGGKGEAVLAEARPVGGVVHASVVAEAPGAIRIGAVDRLILGQPDGRISPVTAELARLVEAGGVPCSVSPAIRSEIWAKLWGNMNLNPVSALTRASAGTIFGDERLVAVMREMMGEFQRVGERIGVPLPITLEERLAITRRLGDFRTSMLNDVEAGRPLEVDGLLGVVVEMAEKLSEPVPVSRIIYALTRAIRPASLSPLAGRKSR
jgi:2-dehydropantoate 2-reductase